VGGIVQQFTANVLCMYQSSLLDNLHLVCWHVSWRQRVLALGYVSTGQTDHTEPNSFRV